MKKRILPILVMFILIAGSRFSLAGDSLKVSLKKQFGFEEIMKFNALRTPVISNNGEWLSYALIPERGEPNVKVNSTINDSIFTVLNGTKPQFSTDSKWLAAVTVPKQIELENLENDKDKPKNGLVLLNLTTGEISKMENVEKFIFSNDSKWLIYKLFNPDEQNKTNDAKSKKSKNSLDSKLLGSELVFRRLQDGSELTFNNVLDFDIDSTSRHFAYSTSSPDGKANALYSIDIINSFFPKKIKSGSNHFFTNLAWNHKQGLLAFIESKENKDKEADSSSLIVWNVFSNELNLILKTEEVPQGWFLPNKNDLKWTKDGNRLFFGIKPLSEKPVKSEKITYNDTTLFNTDTILKGKDLDVWHWDDPRIKPNERIWWKENKDKIYRAVYHVDLKKVVQLADTTLPEVNFVENPDFAIGINPNPYLKEISWDDDYYDLHVINLHTGAEKLIAKHLKDVSQLSPGGKFIVYFQNKNWNLYDCRLDTTIVLTRETDVPFCDEDHDQPDTPPSYGIGGWLENDDAVIIYDKYDIWKFYTGNGYGLVNQTASDGRLSFVSYRIRKTNPEKIYFKPTEDVIVTGFNWRKKETGIYRINMNILGSERILRENKKFSIVAKAKDSNKYVISRQAYNEFPDLWVCDSTFSKTKKISDANPQLKDFYWGNTQLIEWYSYNNDTLQGYIIKPDNFDSTKKYPVIIYFYERESNDLYDFIQPYTGHRLCFPVYSGEDYVIFLPDIKYRIGNPGKSAYDCILSGIDKLINMGIADSNAIGLWGHSWSGYQTAFLITQTNRFAAAVAGCPVGNMTSSYSGIRWESGLSRQMQYEKQQSRIGGTLWDSLTNYIYNSPVFNLKNETTPFLIMFGDEDPKVPWQQGIELYLDMRRLNKKCIFLEYHGEGHWPEKYPNRLDYAKKTFEFYNTYLKKMQSPDWILKGVEYKPTK